MVYLQYLLPHNQINKLASYLGNCSIKCVKNLLISYFLKNYAVDLQECVQPNPFEYQNYNDFFTRKLHKNARILDPNPNSIISPADGYIAQYGNIKNDLLISAKGAELSLESLLANAPISSASVQPNIEKNNKIEHNIFASGKFITIYLAPHNYHRVHMPITASVKQMLYVPGKLFSVNNATISKIPNIYTKNERVIVLFDSDIGKIALVLIGAMVVGSIVTSWHGQVTPAKSRTITSWGYSNNQLTIERGAEMGLFQLGSTVIVLFENNAINFSNNITIEAPIKMGEKIATY